MSRNIYSRLDPDLTQPSSHAFSPKAYSGSHESDFSQYATSGLSATSCSVQLCQCPTNADIAASL